MSNENKVILIIDSSEAFLRSKVQDVFVSWGFVRSNVKELTEWQFIPKAPTLFGERMMTHLDLTGKGAIKKFAELISLRKMQDAFKGDWYGNGLIITASTSVGLSKVEKLVVSSGGRVIKKEKSVARKKEMLSGLNVSLEVKNAVDGYAGEDYDLMLSFVNAVSKLTIEEQRAITPEIAFSYFPPIPGSVPPWDYLNVLLNGNTSSSIELFKRTIKNTHILVPLVFITKKMQLLYRLRLSMEDGIKGDKNIAIAMGEKPGWDITNLMKTARRLPLSNVENIAIISNRLESDLKGGSHADVETEFIIVLTKIGMLLGNRQ